MVKYNPIISLLICFNSLICWFRITLLSISLEKKEFLEYFNSKYKVPLEEVSVKSSLGKTCVVLVTPNQGKSGLFLVLKRFRGLGLILT